MTDNTNAVTPQTPSVTTKKSRKKSSRTGALRLGLRLGAGTIVVAGAVAALAAGILAPLPTVSATAPEMTVDPAPGATTLVCSSSFLMAGRDPLAAQALAIAGSLTQSPAAAPDTAVTTTDVAGVPGAQTEVRSAQAVDGIRADIPAASSLVLSSPDVAGFAASACRPTVTEGWFVGLDTRTGSSGVVLLTNPGTVTSLVTLTVLGAAGPIDPVTVLSVPAGTSLAVPVAGLTGTEATPVIHLHAEGSPVQAVVQSSVTRGLVAVGIDVEDPVRTDALTQVMPGVTVTPGSSATAVRLLATEAATTATVEFRRADGSVAGGGDVDLTVGVPTDVPFESIPAGVYDVVVSADSAIVSAAWHSTGTEAGDDYTWYPAAPILDKAVTTAIASGAAATLRIANPGSDDVEVLLDGGVSQASVTLPAGGGVDVAVTAGQVVSMDPQGASISASVSYAQEAGTAAVAVWPADAASSAVTITR